MDSRSKYHSKKANFIQFLTAHFLGDIISDRPIKEDDVSAAPDPTNVEADVEFS
jgi:hypothetical protein